MRRAALDKWLGLGARQKGTVMADEIDWTSPPARVLAAIAKARGEPIDDARVEALAALRAENKIVTSRT